MTQRSIRRSLLQVALTAALSFAETSAFARPFIPDLFREAVGIPCTPHCSMCHIGTPGVGTARTKFVSDAINHGFDVYSYSGDLSTDVPKLQQNVTDAWLADTSSGADADRDGINDLQELKDGTDPNDAIAGASVCGSPGPEYGCFRVGHGRTDGTAMALAAATLLVGIARMRRRAR